MEKIKIAYYPKQSGYNSYAILMQKILSEFTDVKGLRFRDLICFVFFFNKVDYIFINWLENEVVDKDGNYSLIRSLLIKFFINLLLLKSIKIIFVYHNFYPHKTKDKDIVKVINFISWLKSKSYKVIVHSESDAHLDNEYYVPHPLYKFNDKFELSEVKYSNVGEYFIIMGAISKYKKIHEIIKRWDLNESLIVVGAPVDKNYLEELEKIAIDKKNVYLLAEFLSDDQAAKLVRGSKAMIITNSGETSLVSGSFFFSLSVDTPIIAIENKFIKEFTDRKFVFSTKKINDLVELCRTFVKCEQLEIDTIKEKFSEKIIKEKFENLLQKNNLK